MEECPLCETKSSSIESHHIWPIQYGGPESGKQVSICGNCHAMIHKQAENLMNNQPARLYADKRTLARARPLIAAIARAKLHHMKRRHKSFAQPRRVSLKLDEITLAKLHMRKIDAGYTNLAKYIRAVLTQLANRGDKTWQESVRKYPSRKD